MESNRADTSSDKYMGTSFIIHLS
uniref:Uncharacterized protein n=1 Tax=Rhizophora mucronata TaxID=61149 RepID=A0A2P2QIN9_RHIMU